MKKNAGAARAAIWEAIHRLDTTASWTAADERTFDESVKDALYKEAFELIKAIGRLP